MVDKVYIDVSMTIHDDLAQFIYDERTIPNEQGDRSLFLHEGLKPGEPDYDEFAKQYEDAGRKVLELALITYNRFIAFARNAKGQYWLYERPYKPASLNQNTSKFRAQFKLGDHDWFPWRPPTIDQVMVVMGDNKEAIKREDWSSFQDFVAGNRNPYIVDELLTNSEFLLEAGLRRSAVIEAVSALEVALSGYAKSPDTSSLTSEVRKRIDVSNLHQQVSHLGLKGTVRYLLPLLISPEKFPTETLQNCQKAVDVRNAVVHRGQRDVDPAKTYRFVHAIKEACYILASVTAPSG